MDNNGHLQWRTVASVGQIKADFPDFCKKYLIKLNFMPEIFKNHLKKFKTGVYYTT